MKNACLFLAMALPMMSICQLNQIVLEEYLPEGFAEYQPDGTTTYRLYAELNDPNDALIAVWGSSCSTLSINTTTNFYNEPNFGVVLASEAETDMLESHPEVRFDSWLTIGYDLSQSNGDQFVSQAMQSPNDPLTDPLMQAAGSNIHIDEGSWFSNQNWAGSKGVGENNRVLLGQFTTSGLISYQLNVRVKDGGSPSQFINYLWNGNTGCIDNGELELFHTDLGLSGQLSACGNPEACNYDSSLSIDEIDDNSCEFLSCSGCIDPESCDFNELATIDDGSCGTNCSGCTSQDAINFNATASIEDGSCLFVGCLNASASNYNPDADFDDSSCIFLGCTDDSACNFDANANQDDGSCTGDCAGCTDSTFMNYHPNATTDDGSCTNDLLHVFNEVYYTDDGTVEGYPEGATTYRIYANVNDAYVLSAGYALLNCTDAYIRSSTYFWNSELGGVVGSSLNSAVYEIFPSVQYDTYVTIGAEDNSMGSVILASTVPDDPFSGFANQPEGTNFEMEDGVWFATSDLPNGVPDENGNVLVAQLTTTGEISYKLNFQLIRVGSITPPVTFNSSECPNERYASDIGLIYPLELCNLEGACNYVDTQNTDAIDNSVCEYESCSGCTDEENCEYDPLATIDNGSCNEFCLGCTNEEAVNHDPFADVDDGSCLFGACQYPNANNYNLEADLVGIEYCDLDGCSDEQAMNYNSFSNGMGECIYDCENAVVFEAYGDPWDWENAAFFITDSDGNLVSAGELLSLDLGVNSSTQAICLPAGDYTIETYSEVNDGETTFSIVCDDVIVSGGFSDSVSFTLSDASCAIGCTNPNADNYNELATLNFNCQFSGCSDPSAENYSSQATIEDGSCVYFQSGTVFYDANSNGVFDNQFDYGIGLQQVLVNPGELVLITDENGLFSLNDFPAGNYSISLLESNAYPNATTAELVSVVLGEQDVNPIKFGLSNDEAFYAICVDIYPTQAGYPCDAEGIDHNICFRNMGTETINGYVEFEYDEAFQGHTEITPIDAVYGDIVSMPFENLQPGEMFFYDIGLLAPDEEFFGESLLTAARVYGFNNGQIQAYGESSLSMEVTCSYNNNDHIAFPEGVQEPHYIVEDTDIEYIIRFQNTGNAIANNVVIRDTLSEYLDLSSIQLFANTHNVLTSIDPTSREIVFTFENILLPDSATDESQSRGLVSFLAKPITGIPAETVITNTAQVYFDDNDAQTTNTTWHTIYQCAPDDNLPLESTTFCFGASLVETIETEDAENYLWAVNGEQLSTSNALKWTPNSPGEYNLTFTASNELCSTTWESDIEVIEMATPTITSLDATLTSSQAPFYQWFLNGEEINGATEQVFQAIETGEYTVQVISSEGCSAISEAQSVIVIGIDEVNALKISVFPNPVHEQLNIFLSQDVKGRLSIIDASGREVWFSLFDGSEFQFDCSQFASGKYSLRFKNKESAASLNFVVQ